MRITDSDKISFNDVFDYFKEILVVKTSTITLQQWNKSTLSDIIKVANNDYFDPRYKKYKNSLSSFRNYGVHNSRRLKIKRIKERLCIT